MKDPRDTIGDIIELTIYLIAAFISFMALQENKR